MIEGYGHNLHGFCTFRCCLFAAYLILVYSKNVFFSDIHDIDL